MRKRDRLKRRLRDLLGASKADETTSNQNAAPEVNALPDSPAVHEARVAPVASSEAVPDHASTEGSNVDDGSRPASEGGGAPEQATEAAAAEVDAKAAEMAKKAAKHVERTRVAMLKFIVEQGGQAGLADMHDLSERRYFIGHKRFSNLMEGIVDEGLIEYDHGAGIATITEDGRAYIDQ